ncbi:MAG: hypothetical protein ABSE22_03950 [Xanthobacteraceae bacterium]
MADLIAAAPHGDATRLAELRRFLFHAGCDLRHVGNKIGTQPDRVGRARLAGGVAAGVVALRAGAIETANQRAGQQHQTTGETSDPHSDFPHFRELVPRAATSAAGQGADISTQNPA